MCVHVNRNVPLALYDCVFDRHSDTAAEDDDDAVAFFNLNTFVCFFSSPLSPLYYHFKRNKKIKNKIERGKGGKEKEQSHHQIYHFVRVGKNNI